MATSSRSVSASERRRRFAPLLLGAVLLIFWISVWASARDTVLVQVPQLDERHYLLEAAAVAQGRWLPAEPFYMSPLYPYLAALAGAGTALGEDGLVTEPPWGLWLLQASLWAVVAWLIHRTAFRMQRAWGRSVPAATWLALVPVLLYLLYRPAVVFALLPLLEGTLTFLVVVVLDRLSAWSAGQPESPATRGSAPAASPAPAPTATRAAGTTGGFPLPSRRQAVIVGLAIGAAILLRGSTAVLLVPAVAVVAAAPASRRSRVRRGLLVVAAAAVPVLPVVAVNSALAGRPVGPSLNAGVNLYIGNGPEAQGFFTVFTEFDFSGDPAGVAYLERKLGRPVAGRAEADRIWAREAWRAVQADPVDAARLYLRKVWLHLQAWEIAQLTALPAWNEAVAPLKLLIVPYGLLSTLGLAGAALVGWRERRLRPWLAALVLLVAMQSVFFVVARYRQVLVPILALLGGLLVTMPELTSGLRSGRRAPAAGGRPADPGRRRVQAGALLAVLLAALAVWPWGLDEVQSRWRALGWTNTALRYQLRAELRPRTAAADLERAGELLEQALPLIPDRPEPYRGLARLRAEAGDLDGALALLEEGLAAASWPVGLYPDLIELLLGHGREEQALVAVTTYLQSRPDDIDMRHNQVVLLDRLRPPAEALAAARRFLADHPTDPRPWVDLGVLLARAGRPDEARQVFAAGLQRHPGHPHLTANLERLR
ncbi:MAG: hypothetical protein R6X25_03200 [Candidatus Krumholzibacteriia bacterium]